MALIYGKNTNAVMLLQFEKFWLFPQVRCTTPSTIDAFYRQISYFYNVYSYISEN